MHPDHDCPLGLRAPARLQPRHRLQGVVVGGPAPVRAAARYQRQPPVVPRDVDVLGPWSNRAPAVFQCGTRGPGGPRPNPLTLWTNESTMVRVVRRRAGTLTVTHYSAPST